MVVLTEQPFLTGWQLNRSQATCGDDPDAARPAPLAARAGCDSWRLGSARSGALRCVGGGDAERTRSLMRSHVPLSPSAKPASQVILTHWSPSTRIPRPHSSGQTRFCRSRTASTASSEAALLSSLVPALRLNASSARREIVFQSPLIAPL